MKKDKKIINRTAYRLIIIMIVMLSIPLVSALEFDNVKTYDAVEKTITIKNAYGLGDTLAEYKLTKNTDYCLINCYAEGIAQIYNEEPLFQDMKFYDTMLNEKNIEYKIFTGEEVDKEIEIADYGEVC